jgi:hypothetical protein
MEIYTIISPDKLSMSMFSDYFQSIVSGVVRVIDINCLTSKPLQEAVFEETLKVSEKYSYLLVKYKTKIKTVLDLPASIFEKSNYIIKFDLFSTHPEVIKGSLDNVKSLIERWMIKVSQMDEIV